MNFQSKGLGGGVVVLFEGEDLGGELIGIFEVVGEELALADGEADLEVEPAGAGRGEVQAGTAGA